jgi:hypothetical protein
VGVVNGKDPFDRDAGGSRGAMESRGTNGHRKTPRAGCTANHREEQTQRPAHRSEEWWWHQEEERRRHPEEGAWQLQGPVEGARQASKGAEARL